MTGNKIYRCKVIPIPITQQVIDRVEYPSKEDGIKSLLKFKDNKEETFIKDDDENDDNDASIKGVDNGDEKEYEPNIEDDITYNGEIEREEWQELENEGVLIPGVDTEEENIL